MRTDEHLDTMCELIDVVDDILSDSACVEKMQKVSSAISNQKTNAEVLKVLFAERKALTKLLLKDKKEELYKIISILSDKTVEDIRGQLLIQTMLDVKTCFNDKELVSFFKQQAVSK